MISEGVHKVSAVEEQINSLFFALMNPEDRAFIKEEKMESLESRIQYNKIPFVLEPTTEANIYRSNFGLSIDQSFLPGVLENFARVIVSTRMQLSCSSLKDWISDLTLTKYSRHCDANGLLLRMDIYNGVIPDWLPEGDRKRFTNPVRRALIAEGEKEGNEGLDGRNSLRLFNDFFSRYGVGARLISIENVGEFFRHRTDKDFRGAKIPQGFLDALINSYDYAVLNQVKEALYFSNQEQITKDILHFLCAVNHDPGVMVRCGYTGEEIEVTVDFFKLIGSIITGKSMNNDEALSYAREIQKKYAAILASGVRNIQGIQDTGLYHDLLDPYARNLKDKALQPFVGNENFREAIKAFGTKAFDAFDPRLRERINRMIRSLMARGYTERGAEEICLYVLDKKLATKFV